MNSTFSKPGIRAVRPPHRIPKIQQSANELSQTTRPGHQSVAITSPVNGSPARDDFYPDQLPMSPKAFNNSERVSPHK